VVELLELYVHVCYVTRLARDPASRARRVADSHNCNATRTHSNVCQISPYSISHRKQCFALKTVNMHKEMSQHSSNPLELPSSDVRNKTALHRYRKARAMAGNQRDSDEPEDELEVSDLKDYQRHIAGLLQDRPAAQAQYTIRENTDPEVLIDLDEDVDCDKGQDYDGENSDEYDGDSGMEADGYAEIDEGMTLFLKSREEQEEIELEIADLEEAVPAITEDYKLIDRLGTGTFSSVYKAIDLGYHEKWDNGVWHGLHPAASSAHYQSVPRAPGTKIFVAVKRIYVTSNPERIRNEISILETCRGARHVSQLITAFRHEDQVVAIMPYHAHEDFRVRLHAYLSLRRFIEYDWTFRSHSTAHFRWPASEPTLGACFVRCGTFTRGVSSTATSSLPIFSSTLTVE
jgi:cell division control protein 7